MPLVVVESELKNQVIQDVKKPAGWMLSNFFDFESSRLFTYQYLYFLILTST